MKRDIPWDDIDAEIRPLIRLLNERPGIVTEWSCAGHGEEEGYFIVIADSLVAIRSLLILLPKPGYSISMLGYAPPTVTGSSWHCSVDTDCPDSHRLRFRIAFYGTPRSERFALVAAMEDALRGDAS